jgi:hypothetical protein
VHAVDHQARANLAHAGALEAALLGTLGAHEVICCGVSRQIQPPVVQTKGQQAVQRGSILATSAVTLNYHHQHACI